jgi:hypothetical protein
MFNQNGFSLHAEANRNAQSCMMHEHYWTGIGFVQAIKPRSGIWSRFINGMGATKLNGIFG